MQGEIEIRVRYSETDRTCCCRRSSAKKKEKKPRMPG